MMAVFGEPGPRDLRDWAYLALMPFGFAAGYLLGWTRPALGGCFALTCMAASLVVAGSAFGWQAYLVWAVLCVPAVLFIIAGLLPRQAAPASPAPSLGHSL